MKTVLVNKRYNGQRMDKAPSEVQRVVHTYQDGRVRTSSGDVWTVKPYGGDKADLIVVR